MRVKFSCKTCGLTDVMVEVCDRKDGESVTFLWE